LAALDHWGSDLCRVCKDELGDLPEQVSDESREPVLQHA
jgi:hypothetical protein